MCTEGCLLVPSEWRCFQGTQAGLSVPSSTPARACTCSIWNNGRNRCLPAQEDLQTISRIPARTGGSRGRRTGLRAGSGGGHVRGAGTGAGTGAVVDEDAAANRENFFSTLEGILNQRCGNFGGALESQS